MLGISSGPPMFPPNRAIRWHDAALELKYNTNDHVEIRLPFEAAPSRERSTFVPVPSIAAIGIIRFRKIE